MGCVTAGGQRSGPSSGSRQWLCRRCGAVVTLGQKQMLSERGSCHEVCKGFANGIAEQGRGRLSAAFLFRRLQTLPAGRLAGCSSAQSHLGETKPGQFGLGAQLATDIGPAQNRAFAQ